MLVLEENKPNGRDSQQAGKEAESAASACGAGAAGRKMIVFAIVVFVWLALDQVSKAFVNADGSNIGRVLGEPVLGLFDIRLVYNTGGAWSIFSDATFALGIFSLLMCAAVATFAVWARRRLSFGEVTGLALVVAGGLGNAIDRFAMGHVVDFINLLFMDFPVFNIADIGVTCGLALFLVSSLVCGGILRSGDSRGADYSDEGGRSWRL